MKFEAKRLYNAEVKLRFLDEYGIEDSTKKTFYNNFLRIQKLEEVIGKDVYEMADDELELVLYGVNITTEIAIVAFYSNIRIYSNWCNENLKGYYKERFNGIHFSKIANKYVSKDKRSFFTQQDLLDKYQLIANQSDMLIIQATFEGISGTKRSEILNLRACDTKEVDGKYYVDLYDSELQKWRRDYEITELLYSLIHKSSKETIYMNDQGHMLEMVMNDYAIRKTTKGKKSPILNSPVQPSLLYTRGTIMKELFKPDNFSLSSIEASGIMEYLYELIKDQENEVKEVTFTHLTKISDRYNIAKYVHSITLEETISYAFIKAKINKDFFEKNYCKFNYVKSK